ncbi:hypothetical protein TNCV_1457351 [Trichonephila clavipes]|nr:hypothetical protein TNCV_1457351 [Trichonephila clavipes]
MVLPGKVRGELIKLYYQNGMNAAEALRVCITAIIDNDAAQMLEPGDPQQRLDFANEFCYDMMRITTGHFAYYGRTRRISP